MTPLTKIDHLYFKREDQNITGSAKDRALPLQVQNLIQEGYTSAVISSTGNAAISASFYCQQANIPLTIFVSPKIKEEKISLLKGKIIKSPKPISDAIKFSKSNHAYLLRQSTDPIAKIAYGQIATEILMQLPNLTSIFIPVGSGTTLLGISLVLPENVKIFAVQPASNPTISSAFVTQYTKENDTITDALSVKYLPLKREIDAGLLKKEMPRFAEFASAAKNEFEARSKLWNLLNHYELLNLFDEKPWDIYKITRSIRGYDV